MILPLRPWNLVSVNHRIICYTIIISCLLINEMNQQLTRMLTNLGTCYLRVKKKLT